jgi:hypothetical protein
VVSQVKCGAVGETKAIANCKCSSSFVVVVVEVVVCEFDRIDRPFVRSGRQRRNGWVTGGGGHRCVGTVQYCNVLFWLGWAGLS